MKAHSKLPSCLLVTLTTLISPLAAEEIFRINHDDFTTGGSFTFAYAGYGESGTENTIDVGSSIAQSSEFPFGIGVDGTSAFRIIADTSATEAAIPTSNRFTFMGFGLGLDTNLNQTLPTSDLSQYQVEFSAAASGFADGQTRASGLVDIRFFAPDGTLLPDDADFESDLILTARYTGAAVAEADFVANSFRLDRDFEVRDGSVANFDTYFASVNLVQVVVEITDGINTFGFDADNEIIIDDLIFTNNEPPAPPSETPIVTIDFDANPRFFGGSFYAFAGPLDNNVDDLIRTDDIMEDATAGPSFVQRNCLDTSPWQGADPLEGTGFLGFAGSAAAAPAAGVFPTGNPADYNISFDARADGFLTQPSGKFIITLSAPDDTLSPADDDTEDDFLIRFRADTARSFANLFTLQDSFLTYTFNLGDLEVDSTDASTREAWLTNFDEHNEIISQAIFTLEGITTSTATDFDDDNCIYLNNVQLSFITPAVTPNEDGPAIVGFSAVAPNQLSLTFQSIPGHLYSITANGDLTSPFLEIDEILATGEITTFSTTLNLLDKEFLRVEDLGVPEE